MSHFLQRLVARSEQPAIRPRVAGRFELGPWADPAVGAAGNFPSTSPPQQLAMTDPPPAATLTAHAAVPEIEPATASPDAARDAGSQAPERAMPRPPAAPRRYAAPPDPDRDHAAAEAAPA